MILRFLMDMSALKVEHVVGLDKEFMCLFKFYHS